MLPAKCHSGDQIKNNETGWTCGTHGKQERCIQDFDAGGHLSEKDHLEDLGLDGKITIKCIFKKWDGGVDRIGRPQHRAFMDSVMNLRVL